MAKIAIEQTFGTLSTYTYPSGYDSTKLGLGSLMVQNNGGTTTTNFVGPFPIAVARPMEQSTPISAGFPWAMTWDTVNGIDWVFVADNSAAATTRKISMYTFNRVTQAFSWSGYITTTPPSGTNHIIRGFFMTYDKITAGTVAVSGTAVTGTGTAFNSCDIPAGCRIGFGSTDPTQILTWYEISSISNDTSITLTGSAGSIGAGSAYVIEDLRAVYASTASTVGNGGLFVSKGLRMELFTSGGTTISAAVSTDGVRATYQLADAAGVTNTVSFGASPQTRDSFTQHYVWTLDSGGGANVTLYKYNIRAALTLSSGKDTTAFQFKTGQLAVTGTPLQFNNGTIATANHGGGKSAACLYFSTPTRIYRTYPLSSLNVSSVSFLAEGGVENPAGGTNTVAVGALMFGMIYISSLDMFYISQNQAAIPFKHYITKFRSDASPFDRNLLLDTRQQDQTSADATATPHPSLTNHSYMVYDVAGLTYLIGIGTTAATNILYAVPFGADWEYTSSTNQVIVLPAMTTTNCVNFSKAYVNAMKVLGGSSSYNIGKTTEPLRLYYRTSGITDNSGAWVLVGDNGDISNVPASTSIQFQLQFRTIGDFCIPARVLAVGVTYNDSSPLVNYQPSAGQSSPSTKKFAWRFVTAFGSSVPALRVRLYDAVSGNLLVDDNTTSPTGTFERSTNGGSSWSAWNNTDQGGSTTTYLRYTPATLGDNLTIRTLLTLL